MMFPHAAQLRSIKYEKLNRDYWDESVGVRIAALTADLSALGGRKPLAVRLGWPIFTGATKDFKSDDMCCVHAASQKSGDFGGARAPCVPGSCALYSSESELPANPFFATIGDNGKCACMAPQECSF